MQFLKLILSFAPWLSFLIIARGGLFQLKLGLAVALALSVVMGLARLHRGLILWVGLSFFALASVAVIGFENLWTARHMGVLANGALAAGAWLGVALKKPFTLDYAREHVAPELWNSPAFLRSCQIIASVWAGAFTINAGLAGLKMMADGHEVFFEALSYALLLAAAGFTQIFPLWLRRRGAAH